MNDLEKRISDPSIKVRIKFSDLFPEIVESGPGFCALYIFQDIAVVVTGKTREILMEKKERLDSHFSLMV